MIKKVLFLYKVYSYAAGFFLIIGILDQYAAGKILKIFDPTFRNLIVAKLKGIDTASTEENVLHILKPQLNHETVIKEI